MEVELAIFERFRIDLFYSSLLECCALQAASERQWKELQMPFDTFDGYLGNLAALG